MKVAGFAALMRVFVVTFDQWAVDWQPIVYVLAVLTLIVGAVLAVGPDRRQADDGVLVDQPRRLHPGRGRRPPRPRAPPRSSSTSATYTFIVAGTFGVITIVAGSRDARTTPRRLPGPVGRRPVLALAFTVLLLAQAGVPLTSGFFAKFYVVLAAVDAHSYWLAVVAMLTAVISAFVYLRVVVAMYMSDEDGGRARRPAKEVVPWTAGLGIGLAVFVTLLLGILPWILLDVAEKAVPVLVAVPDPPDPATARHDLRGTGSGRGDGVRPPDGGRRQPVPRRLGGRVARRGRRGRGLRRAPPPSSPPGTGKFYSNGFALEQIIEDGTIGEVIPDALRLFARLLRLPRYTVAALNGHAYAAGAMIAMAHDARVMRADRGYWCLPEADMGVPLAPGMSQLIAAKLTPAVTHAAVVTARRWGGEEAVDRGHRRRGRARGPGPGPRRRAGRRPGRRPGGHRRPPHRPLRPPPRRPRSRPDQLSTTCRDHLTGRGGHRRRVPTRGTPPTPTHRATRS